MTIQGKVVDSANRKPLQNATVTLYDGFNDPTGYGTLTKQNGEFSLNVNTLPGSSVVVSYGGFVPVKISAGALAGGSVVEIPLVVKELPPVVVTPQKKKSTVIFWAAGLGLLALLLLTSNTKKDA